MTIRPAIAAPISDLASAKAWIDGIVNAGLDFHFDDNPDSIVNLRTGESTFTPAEWPILRQRVASLRSFDSADWAAFDCPIGYMIHALEQRDAGTTRDGGHGDDR